MKQNLVIFFQVAIIKYSVQVFFRTDIFYLSLLIASFSFIQLTN